MGEVDAYAALDGPEFFSGDSPLLSPASRSKAVCIALRTCDEVELCGGDAAPDGFAGLGFALIVETEEPSEEAELNDFCDSVEGRRAG